MYIVKKHGFLHFVTTLLLSSIPRVISEIFNHANSKNKSVCNNLRYYSASIQYVLIVKDLKNKCCALLRTTVIHKLEHKLSVTLDFYSDLITMNRVYNAKQRTCLQ
jgi:hypothetical protein